MSTIDNSYEDNVVSYIVEKGGKVDKPTIGGKILAEGKNSLVEKIE